MKLRFIYAITGGLAGILLGGLVAIWVIAVGAGLSWLYLFGDNAWPAALAWVLSGLGFGAGLVVFLALLGLGFAYGRRQENRPDRTSATRRAYGLLGLSLFLIVTAGAGLTWKHQADTESRATRAELEATFQSLLRQRQRITAVAVLPATRPEETSLHLTTEGQIAGRYRLGWKVDYSLYNATLLEGRRELTLVSGSNGLDLNLDQTLIAQSYRKTVLQGLPGAVLVDQTFDGQLWLEPLLTAEQEAEIPPHERQNLSLGYSDLRDHRKIAVPVKFKILASGEVAF